MILDFYGLFDFTTGDGDAYQYTASEFNTIIKSITGNGVVKGQGNEMAVSANGLTITINTGIAFAEGRIGEIKNAKSLTLSAASAERVHKLSSAAGVLVSFPLPSTRLWLNEPLETTLRSSIFLIVSAVVE